MNNLETASNININADFKVNQETGECYISQRKSAELCGVALSTLQNFIGQVKGIHINGLTPDTLHLSVSHYAEKGRIEAVKFLGILAKAGAKAFIYQGAGLTMEAQQPALPATYLEALEKLVEVQKEKEALEKQALLDAPVVRFGNHVVAKDEHLNIGTYSKLLSQEFGIKLGQNKLFEYLRSNGYLMVGRGRRERNNPYQKYIDLGWFTIKVDFIHSVEVNTTFITGKGQLMLSSDIIEHFSK